MSSEWRRKLLQSLTPPLLLACAVIAVWQWFVSTFEIQRFLLPSPWLVFQAFANDWSGLLSAARITVTAALCGLAMSTVVGTFIAIVFSQSAILRRSGYPYAIYLQSAPIVAIAPLLATWVGEGFFAIVIVVFIISLFPIITNATDGLIAIPSDLHEFFRLNKATRWQVLTRLQLPNALPRILTGIKISSAMVVLGATIGEYFVGSFTQEDNGLGHVIFTASSNMQTDRLFAVTILCTILSVIIFYSVSGIARRVVYWDAAGA